jgi:hypothetical protein
LAVGCGDGGHLKKSKKGVRVAREILGPNKCGSVIGGGLIYGFVDNIDVC